MSVDIFISYSSEDRDKAYELASFLQSRCYSVFWDRIIPAGKSFDEEIERALCDARVVIVLWSKAAISSEWVRAEAEEAAARKIIVPILIEDVNLPLRFKRIQALNFKTWNLDSNISEVRRLLNSIDDYLGRPLNPEEVSLARQDNSKFDSNNTIENLIGSDKEQLKNGMSSVSIRSLMAQAASSDSMPRRILHRVFLFYLILTLYWLVREDLSDPSVGVFGVLKLLVTPAYLLDLLVSLFLRYPIFVVVGAIIFFGAYLDRKTTKEIFIRCCLRLGVDLKKLLK